MSFKLSTIKERITQANSKLSGAEYDLPLQHSEDSRFLVSLVGLMTFLAILAFTGTFALNGMTSRWSSGLENKVTIEIPLETSDGHLLSRDTVDKESRKIVAALRENPNIQSVTALQETDIRELLSPWLGTDLDLRDVPLPALISVELKISTAEAIDRLKSDIAALSDFAILQTHQDWLGDLIRFAQTLKILALAIGVLVAAANIAAIAGAIRARLSIYKKEVELLHLMGASDDYIARQFQKNAMTLTLWGSVFGTAFGLALSLFIIVFSGYSGTSLIPRIVITLPEFLSLCLVPITACVIAGVTTRVTVLRNLAKMP